MAGKTSMTRDREEAVQGGRNERMLCGAMYWWTQGMEYDPYIDSKAMGVIIMHVSHRTL